MAEYHIECISLGKQYKGNRQSVTALSDISFGIRPGETVLIKGRSGAGKSTLLHLMCGLVKPTSGKVILDRVCISGISDNELSRILSTKIGIIFQSFNLLPTYTVYENIEIAVTTKGRGKDSCRKEINDLLEQFNLKDRQNDLPPELSVGQQQKVAIVRSLIKRPSIIFADEPTASVDDITASEIIDLFKNLKEQRYTTIVIATHGTNHDSFADRILNIENGQLKNQSL